MWLLGTEYDSQLELDSMKFFSSAALVGGLALVLHLAPATRASIAQDPVSEDPAVGEPGSGDPVEETDPQEPGDPGCDECPIGAQATLRTTLRQFYEMPLLLIAPGHFGHAITTALTAYEVGHSLSHPSNECAFDHFSADSEDGICIQESSGCETFGGCIAMIRVRATAINTHHPLNFINYRPNLILTGTNAPESELSIISSSPIHKRFIEAWAECECAPADSSSDPPSCEVKVECGADELTLIFHCEECQEVDN